MTAVDESLARIAALAAEMHRPVRLMEVCGTHTMALFQTGLRARLPSNVRLISGPGCPVCVTPTEYLDRAIAMAGQPETVVATFGDMLRVPGTVQTLEGARARGAAVRVVYSPMDALALAEARPGYRVVFLGVGFETTTPGVAWSLLEARRRGVLNYAVWSAHKVIPPAMEALLAAGDNALDGFLCPGHVSVILGTAVYEPLADRHHIPCVVTGFTAEDMALGIERLLRQRIEGRWDVENAYERSVDREGNAAARRAMESVFEPADAEWRGLGSIPGSGLALRGGWEQHDASRIFAGLDVPGSSEPPGCRCGDVLRGVVTPPECPLFRTQCRPESPVGACMVSREGTCAAYYRYE